jgi:hypothetical protein
VTKAGDGATAVTFLVVVVLKVLAPNYNIENKIKI